MTKDTKTVGTLQAIGARVGDVVINDGWITPMKFTVHEEHLGEDGYVQDGYRIVSRATPNYLDGEWHQWHGGECPVPGDVMVEVELRDGKVLSVTKAYFRDWANDGCLSDIIRFRVVQSNAEAPNSPVGGEVGVLVGSVPNCINISYTEPDEPDMINAPPHYTSHPSGIEPIQITQHMPFCEGNVIKYVMRAPYKGDTLKDLRKAAYYIQRAIEIEEGKA